MMWAGRIMLCAVLLTPAPGIVAAAESRRSDSGGGDDAMRRAQHLIRSLSQEKTRLEAEQVKLRQERDELVEQVAAVEGKLKTTESRLDQANTNNETLVERVRSDHEKMRQLIDKLQNTQRGLRTEKMNVEHLKSAVVERNEWIDVCRANNHKLHDINVELIDHYTNRSVWDLAKQSEPLAGFGQVDLEVMAEEYKYKIGDLQVFEFPRN